MGIQRKLRVNTAQELFVTSSLELRGQVGEGEPGLAWKWRRAAWSGYW